MISMNIYDGETGAFIYAGKFEEDIARRKIEEGYAVELYDEEKNQPVASARSYSIKTDSDGFVSLIKREEENE